jgi:hypothetical protein
VLLIETRPGDEPRGADREGCLEYLLRDHGRPFAMASAQNRTTERRKRSRCSDGNAPWAHSCLAALGPRPSGRATARLAWTRLRAVDYGDIRADPRLQQLRSLGNQQRLKSIHRLCSLPPETTISRRTGFRPWFSASHGRTLFSSRKGSTGVSIALEF